MIKQKMKKQVFILMLALCFSLTFVSALYCSDSTNLNDIPCIIQTIPLSCSNPVYIESTSNTLINSYVPMTLENISCSGECVYNFNFGYNVPDIYKLQLCDNITYGYINVSNQGVTTQQSDIFTSILDYEEIFSPISYPYVSVNTSYPMFYKIIQNGTSKNIGNINISIGTNDFPFNWDNINKQYYLTLNFTNIGDYPFVIHASNQSYLNFTGTFLVRNPFYIKICGFEKNSWLNNLIFGSSKKRYINDNAYILAEFTGNKQYVSYLEQFSDPFETTIQSTLVFHAVYEDGCANLELYDPNEYALRLLDGQVNFKTTFSQPNITKSYGTNIYIGKYSFTGKDESFNIVLSEFDKRPYYWLFNWIAIIGVVLGIVLSLALIFVIPDYPIIALTIFIISTIGIFILRIIVFLFIG